MRRVAAWLIGIGTGLGLAVAAGMVFLRYEAERRLTEALRGYGFLAAEASIERLGWSGATLRLSLNDDAALQPGTVELSWTPEGLLDGQVQAVVLHRPRLGIEVDAEGRIALAGWPKGADADPGEPEGGILADLPVRRLAVRDGRLTLATPQGAATFELVLELDGEGDGIEGRVVLQNPETRLVAEIAAGDGQGRVGLDGRIGDLGPFLSLAGKRRAVEGEAELNAELSGPWPPMAGAWTGRFAGAVRDAAVAGIVSEASATLEGSVAVSAGRLDIRSSQPWRLLGRLADAGWPDPLRDASTLVLAPPAEGPLHAWVDWSGAELRTGWAGAARAGAADGQAIGALSAREIVLALGDGGPETIKVQGLRGELAPVAWGEARLGVPHFELDLEATPDGAEGRVALRLRAAGALPGNVHVAAGEAAAEGRILWSGEGVRFVPRDCVVLAAETLTVGGQSMTLPRELCLTAPQDRPILHWAPESGFRIDAEGREIPFEMAISGGAGEPLRLVGTLPALALGLEADAAGSVRAVDVSFAEASLRIPDWQIAALDVTGETQYRAGREAPLAVSVRRAWVEHGGEPAWFAPVSLNGTLEGTPGGAMDFRFASEGQPAIRLTGRHDGATGSGWGRLEGRDLQFDPDGLGIAEVSPLMAGYVSDVSGRVALTARFGWGEEGPADSAEILLEDVALTAGPVGLQGVNTVLRADSLVPLVLPPGQSVAIGVTDIGLPLTQGLVRFGLTEDRLAVVQAEWDWAGGRLRARPFALDYPGLTGDIVLDAQKLDLGQVLELVKVEGLAGTGTLTGELPIRLEPETIRIEEGRLAASGPGILRYDPAEPPTFLAGEEGSGTELLRRALANFHYESLAMTVNGTAGGEMAVRLEIRGANPDLYGGYPVALNLNVTGALDTVLRRGLGAYRIPDAVREQMERFQQDMR